MPETRNLKEVEDAVHELARRPRDASQIPELVDLLAAMAQVEDDPESAYEALEWIVREIGQAAVPVLLQTTQTQEPAKRAAALYLLSIVGAPGNIEIIEAAKSALRDKHDIVRETAAGTLAVVADENSISLLIEALGTNSPNDYHIVGALGRSGSSQAIDALTKLLYVEARTVWVDDVIGALEHIGTPDAIAAIRKWKQSECGKTYVDQEAELLLQSLEAAPESHWRQEALAIMTDTTDNEALSLRRDIRFATYAKGLHVPALSGRIVQVLERLNNPRAHKLLEQWRNEQKSK